MKKILAIFMMLIIAHPSLWGQESIKKNPTIDSLETLLQTVKAPREKIKIWDQLSRYYQEIDFDQAIGYAQKMLDYAQKEKDDTLWIKAQQAIGYSSIYKGEIEKALSLFQEAIQRSQKINSPKFIAHGNFSLAFYHYYQGDINQARALFQKAGQGYEQLAMWRRMAEAHNAVAVTYASQSEFKKALESFQQVLEANQKAGNWGAVLVNYTNIGAVNYDMGNYPEGMKAHEKALEIARKQGNTRAIAQCFFQLGTGHHYQSNLVRALDFYQKALHILQELKNPGLTAKVYNQMGNIYVVQKQYEKGIEYHQKALEINQELGNKSGIAYAYNILGDDHIQKNEFTQASRYFQKGLDLYRELEIPQRAGQCLRGLGQCYFYLKDYPQSLSYANQSLELFLEANSQADIFNARALRADVFLASKKTDQAIQEGEKAYLIARDLQNPEIIKSISKTLADAYEVQGRYQKAYDYYKIFKANSDSVLNIGKVKELTTLENQFQYNQEKARAKADREQKEAELAGKIQQQRNLRNAFIIGFALVLLLAFFILRSYLIKRKANRTLSEKNELISLQAEELKITNEMLAEMDRFKQQMTGMLVHDLKNPLNAIIGLAEQDYQAQHQKTIYQSGQNMLHLVSNILDVQRFEEAKVILDRSQVNLRALLLAAFHQVEYLFHQKNIQFNLDCPESQTIHLDPELIKRVLVNLLQNAIKYTPNNGQISLLAEALSIPKAQIKVSLTDSGMGIPQESIHQIFDKYQQVNPKSLGAAHSTGLGLAFSKLAIEAHGGEIGVHSEEGQGSTFWFVLPLSTRHSEPEPKETPADPIPLGPSTWQLESNEKTYLRPFVDQIKQFEFFEISAIKPILQDIDESAGDNIGEWKESLQESIFASNQERFEALINMVGI